MGQTVSEDDYLCDWTFYLESGCLNIKTLLSKWYFLYNLSISQVGQADLSFREVSNKTLQSEQCAMKKNDKTQWRCRLIMVYSGFNG